MGHTVTPTYRVELTTTGAYWTPQGWDTKRQGRPSDATLAAYVDVLERSTRYPGVNAHLGATTVVAARIIRQRDDETVAIYRRPTFEVIDERNGCYCPGDCGCHHRRPVCGCRAPAHA